jgi:benzodiazapine receptor
MPDSLYRESRKAASSLPGPVLSILMLLAFVLLVFSFSAAGAWITQTSLASWYAGLHKPPFTPADWVFPIVWNLLYFMMALAAWHVWRIAGGFHNSGAPLSFFGAQLGLNLSWSVLFFGMRNPLAASFEILLLLAAILLTIFVFWRVSRLAGLLLVPYFVWVCFASYLTIAVWFLNR